MVREGSRWRFCVAGLTRIVTVADGTLQALSHTGPIWLTTPGLRPAQEVRPAGGAHPGRGLDAAPSTSLSVDVDATAKVSVMRCVQDASGGKMSSVPADRLARLRRTHLALAVLHLAQGVAILLLGGDAKLPVTASFLEGPPGGDSSFGETTLFDLPVAPAVAAFLLLAAGDHAWSAGPGRTRYEAALARGRNPYRWAEYSVSASLMVVLVAMLAGTSEGTALVAIFGANAAMILFGDLMERRHEDRETTDWRPFAYGSLVGAVPWIAISLQLTVAQTETDDVPGFVIAIFVTLLLLFLSFAVVQLLQFRTAREARDPLAAERRYNALSLVAKSALAWQVYAGALAG